MSVCTGRHVSLFGKGLQNALTGQWLYRTFALIEVTCVFVWCAGAGGV